jgi:hypothetical protein
MTILRLTDNTHMQKIIAPGEDRTHGLQIMRLTRCLLRYQGLVRMKSKIKKENKKPIKKNKRKICTFNLPVLE